MLAVQVERFGGPDVLVTRETPEPVAGSGQVVVEVAAVDVLFVEAQVRAGWGKEYFPMPLPYVPGDGIAGRVVATGDGVDAEWRGRRVVAYTDSMNAYAERAVVDLDKVASVPDGVELTDAAALTHDGPMAATLLDAAGALPGRTVLVLGANGGAGLLVVQLAAEAGARVIAAARGERKLAAVRRAGAHLAVDPSDPDWLDPVRAAGGVDVVFDGVGGELGTAAFDLVADGGTFFAYGAGSGGFAATDEAEVARRGITVAGIPALARARDEVTTLVARSLEDVAAKRIQPLIGATYQLREAAAAHAAMESRTVLGKILLVA